MRFANRCCATAHRVSRIFAWQRLRRIERFVSAWVRRRLIAIGDGAISGDEPGDGEYYGWTCDERCRSPDKGERDHAPETDPDQPQGRADAAILYGWSCQSGAFLRWCREMVSGCLPRPFLCL